MRFVGPAILVAAALVSLVLGLLFGGGAARCSSATPVRSCAGAADRHPRREPVGGGHDRIPRARPVRAARAGAPFDTALDVASISAALFTVASGFTAFFTFVNIFNATPNAGAEFGGSSALPRVDRPGRAWALTTLAGAALTVLTFAVRGWTSTLFVAALAVASLVPMATQGHSGDDAGHNIAVSALALHIIAAAVWLGGLLLLVGCDPSCVAPSWATPSPGTRASPSRPSSSSRSPASRARPSASSSPSTCCLPTARCSA
jgi:putative copper resistance protein D